MHCTLRAPETTNELSRRDFPRLFDAFGLGWPLMQKNDQMPTCPHPHDVRVRLEFD